MALSLPQLVARAFRSHPHPQLFPPRGGRATWATRLLLAVLALDVAVAALDLALPPDLARAYRSSPVALDRDGAWLRALPVETGRWRIRADLDRTDPVFLKRLVAIEDKRFFLHPGVDPLAIARAAVRDVRLGRITSGGSTLSMQVARRLEPRRRTLLAKLIETLRALQLEARLSKREILALYLTHAPYGGNLEGVRAASLAYFGHEPSSLTDAEQALLIALPQSPEGRRPDRRPAAARAGRASMLRKLVAAGRLAPAAAQEADAQPLPRRAPFPALAWQVAGQLARAAPAGQASVTTTIDARLQARLEQLASQVARAQGGATNAAVLVIETRDRAVRAAVASGGLDGAGGWMDMTRALRSPGSALKPFIYAMAFEAGLASPDSRIADAPTPFAGYNPENFDRAFHGQVSVREALANSLNVPAVATLQRLGPEVFESRIHATGVALVRPRVSLTDPGLALALGGAGITLRGLAALYAGLADGGVVKPLAFTQADAARTVAAPGVRLVTAGSAEQVLDIMRESPAPVGRAPPALTGGPKLAFKTGTSYGYRDAVAAGVGGGYVVVVWTGRADGGARAATLTGRDAALPLLFDVYDALQTEGSAARPIAPSSTPLGLQQASAAAGPRLIFPPDGASLEVDGYGAHGRGLALAASGGERLSWYVDGRPLGPTSGADVVWRPAAPGWYQVSVSDPEGRQARARVRVR